MAEVLIVLGIIGLIADMTIPTLVSSYNKKVTSVRLKSFYSNMSQAIRMSEIDNGSCLDWNRDAQIKTDGEFDYEANKPLMTKFFNSYLAPYLNYVKLDTTSSNYTSFYLADGTEVNMHNGTCIDLIVDTNGDKKPNTSGKDRYTFLICPRGENRYNNHSQCFGSYLSIQNRNTALQNCTVYPPYCTSLLELDNWEFKDDYPHKF